MSDLPDPASEFWTTSDVAAYLNVRVGTVSSYRIRGEMPTPDLKVGRTWGWRPTTITKWRPAGRRDDRDVR